MEKKMIEDDFVDEEALAKELDDLEESQDVVKDNYHQLPVADPQYPLDNNSLLGVAEPSGLLV